jgi:hypothetical protein
LQTVPARFAPLRGVRDQHPAVDAGIEHWCRIVGVVADSRIDSV